MRGIVISFRFTFFFFFEVVRRRDPCEDVERRERRAFREGEREGEGLDEFGGNLESEEFLGEFDALQLFLGLVREA